MRKRIQQFREGFKHEASYKFFIRVVLGISFLATLLFASVVVCDNESSGQSDAAERSAADSDIGRSMAAHDKSVSEAFEVCSHDILMSNMSGTKCLHCGVELRGVPYEQAVEIEPRKIVDIDDLRTDAEMIALVHTEILSMRRDILALRHEIKILNRNIERE